MGLSIIIPVYNKIDNLKAILFCLSNQTDKDFEVIISDDGSTEDIVEKLGNIIKKVPFKIKYIRQSDMGFRAGQARNNGAKISKFEYLVFLDQDIIFPDYFIEKIKKNLHENRVLIYRTVLTSKKEKIKMLEEIKNNYSEFLKIFSLLSLEKQKSLKKLIEKDYIRSLKHRLKLKKRGPSTQGLFIIAKKVYININGFDEEFSGYGYEDIEFSERLYLNGYKSKILKISTLHLYHPSLSEIDKERMEKNKRLLLNKQGQQRAFYGFDNRKDKDKVIYKELN